MKSVAPLEGEHDRHSHHPTSRGGIDGVQDLIKSLAEVSCDAGDHTVGVAQSHHAGAEGVAILVDQPKHVSLQVARTLQARVEIFEEFLVVLRDAGVDDFQLGDVGVHPGERHVLAHQGFSPDQDRLAQTLGFERRGRADHRQFLALGEDDPLGRARLHRAGDLLREARRRISRRGRGQAGQR